MALHTIAFLFSLCSYYSYYMLFHFTGLTGPVRGVGGSFHPGRVNQSMPGMVAAAPISYPPPTNPPMPFPHIMGRPMPGMPPGMPMPRPPGMHPMSGMQMRHPATMPPPPPPHHQRH